jgi:hypothetical protein
MNRLKRLFSPGVIVAVVAMVFALGGTAVADHLITGDDIARNTITGLNIQNESIRGGDIQDGTLTSKQINPNTLRALLGGVQTPTDPRPGAQGAQGPQGEQGERGPEGQRGPAGPRGQDAEARVTALSGDFAATNDTVSMTGDGVEFGPYDTGGSQGGSLQYDGLNGQPLSAVESLIYEARYTATGDTGGVGVPYLRIFTTRGTSGDEHSVVFSPNTQPPDPDVAEGPFHTWAATSGVWRYDDDAGAGGEFGVNGAPLSAVKGTHGDEIITGIFITTGFSAGADLSALLTTLSVNGERFRFGG